MFELHASWGFIEEIVSGNTLAPMLAFFRQEAEGRSSVYTLRLWQYNNRFYHAPITLLPDSGSDISFFLYKVSFSYGFAAIWVSIL